MKASKASKASKAGGGTGRRRRQSGRKTARTEAFDCAAEKNRDESIIMLIRALDLLIAKATSLRLGTPARVLYTAKEDLVYWAAKLFFYEPSEEKFINHPPL